METVTIRVYMVYNVLVSVLACLHVCVCTLHCRVPQGHATASPSSPAQIKPSQTEPDQTELPCGVEEKGEEEGTRGRERMLLHGRLERSRSGPRLCNLPPSAFQRSSSLPLPVCYKYIQPLLIASNRRATHTPNYD